MGAIVTLALQIVATITSIFAKSYEAHQNAPMVLNQMQKFHQQLKDKEAQVDQLAADPHATPEQHARALESIQLSSS